MPNYEELYYITRNKYNQAFEDRNAIRRNAAEFQEKKNALTRELSEKQSVLREIQQKKVIIQETLDKCKDVLSVEFPSMEKDIKSTSEEYKKIIVSDKGVADLFAIYSTDISDTKSNLISIITELERILRDTEEQEITAQHELNNCNNELSFVTGQLKSLGSEAAIQRQINNYYAEMKVYEFKWKNGE